MCNIKTHVLRFFSPIRRAKPTEREVRKLEGSASNEALRSFHVWRRSSLLMACPIVCMSMLIALVQLADFIGPESGLTGLGTFLALLEGLTDVFLLVGMALSLFWWNNLVYSTMALRVGWVAALIAPLLPAIFPLEFVLDGDILDFYADTEIAAIKVSFALIYVIMLLPVVVTFPGSAVRGSLRVRNLFPNSNLPGWILVISAPFYSLVILLALVFLTQVGGNFLLLFGTFLTVARPWVFMIRGGLFVGVSTPEVEKKISRILLISNCVGISGTIMIILWAFTAEVSGVRAIGESEGDDDTTTYLINYAQAAQLLFETIGRIIVTTVFFSDTIVSMVLRNWREEMKREDQLGDERYEDFEAFQHAYEVKKKNEAEESTKNDTESGGAEAEGVLQPPALEKGIGQTPQPDLEA